MAAGFGEPRTPAVTGGTPVPLSDAHTGEPPSPGEMAAGFGEPRTPVTAGRRDRREPVLRSRIPRRGSLRWGRGPVRRASRPSPCGGAGWRCRRSFQFAANTKQAGDPECARWRSEPSEPGGSRRLTSGTKPGEFPWRFSRGGIQGRIQPTQMAFPGWGVRKLAHFRVLDHEQGQIVRAQAEKNPEKAPFQTPFDGSEK